MVNALKEMFSTVKPAVKFNIHVSSCIESYFGVKQRDSNSRLLFILFIDDIIKDINSEIDCIL